MDVWSKGLILFGTKENRFENTGNIRYALCNSKPPVAV